MTATRLPSAKALERLEPAQLTELGGRIKHEHLNRRNAYRTCANCGTTWLARAGALYCQPKCRLAAFRARKKVNNA